MLHEMILAAALFGQAPASTPAAPAAETTAAAPAAPADPRSEVLRLQIERNQLQAVVLQLRVQLDQLRAEKTLLEAQAALPSVEAERKAIDAAAATAHPGMVIDWQGSGALKPAAAPAKAQ